MPFDETLAGRVRRLVSRRKGVTEKKMFGGVGFLHHGNMCIGVWKEYLILRLGIDGYEPALRDEHVKEFDITGKPMRGWVMVEPEGIVDDNVLKAWVRDAFDFVKTLPKK